MSAAYQTELHKRFFKHHKIIFQVDYNMLDSPYQIAKCKMQPEFLNVSFSREVLMERFDRMTSTIQFKVSKFPIGLNIERQKLFLGLDAQIFVLRGKCWFGCTNLYSRHDVSIYLVHQIPPTLNPYFHCASRISLFSLDFFLFTYP